MPVALSNVASREQHSYKQREQNSGLGKKKTALTRRESQ